jgi:prepilin-type N-terminal cleavage/methylation domain-containing protein
MRLPRIKRINLCQGGYTLNELLVAMAITGILIGGVTTSIVQIFTGSIGSSSRMMAVKQIEHAVDTLRSDFIVAQQITPDLDAESGFPLQLIWVDWDGAEEHVITYSLDDDKKLIREEEIDGDSTDRVVAEHIQSISILDPDDYAGGKITLSITSSVESLRSAEVTRTIDILPRPAR